MNIEEADRLRYPYATIHAMSEIAESHIESLITTCGQNAAGIAENLNIYFDRKVRIESG